MIILSPEFDKIIKYFSDTNIKAKENSYKRKTINMFMKACRMAICYTLSLKIKLTTIQCIR